MSLKQAIVTGHENTKLFITHGGLLSTHEAIYNSVPMLGIPVMIDQFLVSILSFISEFYNKNI